MPSITREDVGALTDMQVVNGIFEGVVKSSAVLKMFKRLPNMTSNKTRMRVLDMLPTAYWVNNKVNNGRKNLTLAAWINKFITAAEIAVIVPIKEDIFDDASYDIWTEIKPRLVEAFGQKIDDAVLLGIDKPDEFRADLLTSTLNAGAVVDQTGSLYSAINDAMVRVEESGYTPNAVLGGPDIKGKFRMMLDDVGQPIKGTEIGDIPRYTVDNGTWDKSLSQMIIGDFSQAVYAIRQDITYKKLTEAVIQDPSTGDILYNLAQDDMIALRVVMRLGWEIPNPINALQPDESIRFPFASINPQTAPTNTNNVTFTVTDSSDANVAGAKIVCGGIVRTTGASGTAEIKLPDGTYNYRVSKSGRKAQTGEITVDGAAVSVPVTGF